ncbi:MAG: alpha,alpha-trehalose-phosphate synthase (UDP-forming) [Acidimicrobiales bacterium]
MAGDADLVVVSNRGPFSFESGADGSLEPRAGGGGLAPSLAAALNQRSAEGTAVWVAAALTDGDRLVAEAGEAVDSGSPGLSLRLVAFEPEVFRAAYDVIANSTLWFVLHGLYDASRRPVIGRRWLEAWDHYRTYNAGFAAATSEVAAPGAVVLVNDYHLLLMGSMLARLRPDLRTVHFCHTPFGSPEEMAMLPDAAGRELLAGMAGFGACGFHAGRWERAFLRCSEAFGVATPATFSEPLGPDKARLASVAGSPACAERLAELSGRLGGRRLLLRSDRVELSKNILRGLLAYDTLLEERPEWRGEVVHVIRAYTTREALPEYLAYRAEIEQLVALVNERWSSPGYVPVLLDVDDDFAATVAALRLYDVLLVNPVRDGMNLVAKEGPVLNERGGTLVLSDRAGAFDELAPAALAVNPFDVSATAAAMHEALSIGNAERASTSARLASLASANPPGEWLAKVLSRSRTPAGQ